MTTAFTKGVPGLYPALDPSTYHPLPAFSSSVARKLAMGIAPAAVRHALDFQEETLAMRLGSAAHTALFEPEAFEARYAVYDGVHNATHKAYQAAVEENAGRELIKAAAHRDALAIARAVRATEQGRRMLDSWEFETSVLWKEDGMLCKFRFDAHEFTPSSSPPATIWDLKTFGGTLGRWGARRRVEEMRYDVQTVHAMRALSVTHGISIFDVRCVFLFVETSAPYLTQACVLDAEFLDAALLDWTVAKDTWAACSETQVYPAYGDDLIVLSMGSMRRTMAREALEQAVATDGAF